MRERHGRVQENLTTANAERVYASRAPTCRCTARCRACICGTPIRRSICRSKPRARRSAPTAARRIAWSRTKRGSRPTAAMIVVTGGAGFIGSNLVRELNRSRPRRRRRRRRLERRPQVQQLGRLRDRGLLRQGRVPRAACKAGELGKIEAIFHQGACAVTTEWDGRYMMETNYRYSVELLRVLPREARAADLRVVGGGLRREHRVQGERPRRRAAVERLRLLEVAVRRLRAATPRAARRRRDERPRAGRRAALLQRLRARRSAQGRDGERGVPPARPGRGDGRSARLFEGSGGYAAGEQRRDFVHVGDVVDVNLWFYEHAKVSGVFNVGTGASATFNDVANADHRVARQGRRSATSRFPTS